MSPEKRKRGKLKAPLQLSAEEQDALNAAIEARGGWIDITPRRLGTAEQREALGWRRAYELVNAAMKDYSVQQSPNALKLLSLLQYLFSDAKPADWLSDFDRVTRSEMGRVRTDSRYKQRRLAKAWVQQHYINKQGEYKSKAAFSEDYASLVREEFQVDVKARDIRERWLKKM